MVLLWYSVRAAVFQNVGLKMIDAAETASFCQIFEAIGEVQEILTPKSRLTEIYKACHGV